MSKENLILIAATAACLVCLAGEIITPGHYSGLIACFGAAPVAIVLTYKNIKAAMGRE